MVHLLAFLFLSIGWAQNSLGPKDQLYEFKPLSDCGLVTRYAPNRIDPSCLQQATNVYLDVDSTALRRSGQSKYNATACTDVQSVKGLWPFIDTTGMKWLVIFSSQTFFKTSGGGDCTQITGANSFSSTAIPQCVQTIGKLWCTNGVQSLWSWDGTSTAAYSGAPLASLIGAFRNRVILGQVNGTLTRIRASGELDGTDWTVQIPGVSTTPANIDISGTNDGNQVTCLLGQYQDSFLIARDRDLWALNGNDRRDFTVRKISSEVGCIEQGSVQEKNNSLYWLSRRGVEKMTGTMIQRASDPIRPTVDTMLSNSGNTQSKTFASQTAFQGGSARLCASGPGACMSATISPGGVVPSTSAVSQTSSTTFNGGTYTNTNTTLLQNTIAYGAVTSTYTWDYYKANVTPDNDSPAWTAQNVTGVVSASTLTATQTTSGKAGYFLKLTANSIANHSVFARMMGTNGASIAIGADAADINGFTYPTGGGVISFGASGLVTYSAGSITVGTENNVGVSFSSYTILIDTTSAVSFWRNGTFIGSATVSGAAANTNEIAADAATASTAGTLYVKAFYASDVIGALGPVNIPNTATYLSSIIDMTLSTPTSGPFVSTVTVPTNTTMTYQIRSSSSPNNDLWTSYETVTPPNRPTTVSAKSRYWQYLLTLGQSNLVDSPGISGIGLRAATTGYYVSDCVTTSGQTSWLNFQAVYLNNGGSFTFQVSTGASCASVTADNANWTAQTPNSAFVLPVSSYSAARVLFTIDAATQTPTLTNLTWTWNSGGNRPAVASAVYLDRYYLFYTSSTAAGNANDHALVLDYRDKWTVLDDINAASAAIYQNLLYTGDSTATGTVYLQDTGGDDYGSNYTMTLQTSDMDMGNPAQKKAFKTLYLDTHGQVNPLQNISLSVSYTIDGSTTSYSLGSVNLNEVPEQSGYLEAKLPFGESSTSSPSSGHWLNLTITYTGQAGPVRIYGARIVYEPLDFD